ncbi:ATP-binding protein [Kitasatospora sp. NBC_00315]|uniref:ATP-binding protein n=1 Tax=Kitasatospora sp. NBC_00315 TaxID=2975963 RepID=UPI003251B068
MRLTISRDLPDLGAVEDAVNGALDSLPLGPDSRHQVITAVLEAVSNAVRHGRRQGGRGWVLLETDVVAGQFVLTVVDDGPGFDPRACPDPRSPERLLLPGGRGVFLMHHLMDGVDFAFPVDGGTRVTLRKNLLVDGAHGGAAEGAPTMIVSTRRSAEVTILDLNGRLTIGVGDLALREAVREELDLGTTGIVLNLAKTTAVDSAGVGELVGSSTAARNRGARLVLANLPAEVPDLLGVARLGSLSEVFETEDEAVRSF